MDYNEVPIIFQEKVAMGPLWYGVVSFIVIFSAYLIKVANFAAYPMVAGGILIILVETLFTYPIKYYIYEDYLVAKSGLFKHEIAFKDIEGIDKISWYRLYFFVGGNRMAGMPKDKVIIINPETDKLIITPSKETLQFILNKTQISLQ